MPIESGAINYAKFVEWKLNAANYYKKLTTGELCGCKFIDRRYVAILFDPITG